jgi:hypothetical protein
VAGQSRSSHTRRSNFGAQRAGSFDAGMIIPAVDLNRVRCTQGASTTLGVCGRRIPDSPRDDVTSIFAAFT